MIGRLTLMEAEAGEAAAIVRRLLGANRETIDALVARLRAAPPFVVATTARGSSDHAATYAKYLLEPRLPLLVTSLAPSSVSLYGARPAMPGGLLLAISQSGRSPDLLATVTAARTGGAIAVAMVNDAESPLADAADVLLPLHAGPERSVAATKSYLAALASIAQLAAAWSGDEALAEAVIALPAALEGAWRADWGPLTETLAGVRGLYVVGRGPAYGAAQEMALKLKETCGLHAEAFSAAEVKHGPMALVGPDFPVLVLRTEDAAADGVDALVAELVADDVPVLLAGGEAKGAIALPVAPIHPALAPIAAVQSFYRAASQLSIRRGFDPDRPPRLKKVTETL